MEPYPDEHTWWMDYFNEIVNIITIEAGRPLDLWYARYISRTAYDIAGGLTKEESRDKHLAELRAELGLVAPPEPPDPPIPPDVNDDWELCIPIEGVECVECVHACVKPEHTAESAFEVTKRVAWLLRNYGAGLLVKRGGENIVTWQGKSFSASRICYPDRHSVKVLSDVPATNGPTWQVEGEVPPDQFYHEAIDPNS